MKANNMDLPLYEQWLKSKGRLASSSIYVYTKSVERFLVSNPDVDSLEDYNQFLIKVSVKKRCNHYYSAIKSFIEFKISDSNLRNRLVEGLIQPKEWGDYARERKYLEEDKILEVVNNLEREKHKVVALIQMITGVRAGDVLRLKEGSISNEEYKDQISIRMIVIGKGRKRNVVYIHNKIIQDIIWEYLGKRTKRHIEGYYFLEMGDRKSVV